MGERTLCLLLVQSTGVGGNRIGSPADDAGACEPLNQGTLPWLGIIDTMDTFHLILL